EAHLRPRHGPCLRISDCLRPTQVDLGVDRCHIIFPPHPVPHQLLISNRTLGTICTAGSIPGALLKPGKYLLEAPSDRRWRGHRLRGDRATDPGRCGLDCRPSGSCLAPLAVDSTADASASDHGGVGARALLFDFAASGPGLVPRPRTVYPVD